MDKFVRFTHDKLIDKLLDGQEGHRIPVIMLIVMVIISLRTSCFLIYKLCIFLKLTAIIFIFILRTGFFACKQTLKVETAGDNWLLNIFELVQRGGCLLFEVIFNLIAIIFLIITLSKQVIQVDFVAIGGSLFE